MSTYTMPERHRMERAFALLAELDDAIDRTKALAATIAKHPHLHDRLQQARNTHDEVLKHLTINVACERVTPLQSRADALRHYREYEQELRSILQHAN